MKSLFASFASLSLPLALAVLAVSPDGLRPAWAEPAQLSASQVKDSDEVKLAKDLLGSSLKILDALKNASERQDLPRLEVLRSTVKGVLELIEARGGVGSPNILKKSAEMCSWFYYSADFFKSTRTETTSEKIEALRKNVEQYARNLELDEKDLVPTKTASTFTQMHELLGELAKSPAISEELRSRLNGLNQELGIGIAAALGGDQLQRTLDAGRKLHALIVSLYPDFNKVLSSSPVFDTVLQIQGLNELYASYVSLGFEPRGR